MQKPPWKWRSGAQFPVPGGSASLLQPGLEELCSVGLVSLRETLWIFGCRTIWGSLRLRGLDFSWCFLHSLRSRLYCCWYLLDICVHIYLGFLSPGLVNMAQVWLQMHDFTFGKAFCLAEPSLLQGIEYILSYWNCFVMGYNRKNLNMWFCVDIHQPRLEKQLSTLSVEGSWCHLYFYIYIYIKDSIAVLPVVIMLTLFV